MICLRLIASHLAIFHFVKTCRAWKQCDQMTWKKLNKVAQNISILRGYFVVLNDCHGLQKVSQLLQNYPIQSPCLIIDGCKTIIHNLFYNLVIFHLTKNLLGLKTVWPNDEKKLHILWNKKPKQMPSQYGQNICTSKFYFKAQKHLH